MASRNVWAAAAAAVVIVIIIVASVYFVMTQTSHPPTPTRSMSIYEGDATFNMTSPGPTLNFKAGDVVNMTVYNVGTLAHNWAIVTQKSSTAPVVFNAQVRTGDNPLPPGSHQSVIFTVTQAGNYFYVCQVTGHIDLGLWGTVVVT